MVLETANNYSGRRAADYAGSNEPLLKLLIPNYVAGALLGKGGALLSELKNAYGANIRLSGGNDYYPGTEERIVVIMGEVNHIIDMNNHIMDKVQDPGRDSTMKNIDINGDRAQKVRIVLTDGAAGLLIGRGGATIKGIQEESKARISVAMQDKATVMGERVVTITGNNEERTEACRQVIEKIAPDTSNMSNSKTKYTNGSNEMYMGEAANAGFNSMGGGYESGMLPPFNSRQKEDNRNQLSGLSGNGMSSFRGNTMGAQSYQNQSAKLKAKVEVHIEIPNVFVGGVLGKQGSIIKDFVQRSAGAKFSFSDKTDDADFRTLTITGDMDQAQIAYSLVNERVEQLRREVSLQR